MNGMKNLIESLPDDDDVAVTQAIATREAILRGVVAQGLRRLGVDHLERLHREVATAYTDRRRELIHQQGADAHRAGHDRSENPYDPGTPDAESWDIGFRFASPAEG